MRIFKPVRRFRRSALAAAFGALMGGLLGGTAAQATSVSMTGWSAETWNGGASYWSLTPDGTSTLYTANSNPSVLTGGGSILNSKISFQLTVTNRYGGDDDFFGFVLGYDAGGITGASGGEYLLIDWKRETQVAGPVTAERGLGLSRVVGPVSSLYDLWGHQNSVSELARGTTLGSTGWIYPRSYAFDVLYSSNRVVVSVDGVVQFDLTGNFSDGTFGFYNNSQAGIRYDDLDIEPLPAVPLPASLPLLAVAIGGLGLIRRRRR